MPAWPTSLPVPQVDGYGFSPDDNVVLRTKMQVGSPRTRRVATTGEDTFSTMFDFTMLQMYIFESWYHLEIHDGADWFSMPLHSGAGLTTMSAQVREVFKAKNLNGIDYQVTLGLAVRNRPLMTALQLAPYL